jgi:DNA repair exonuclease SbcCD nuclease subunit
MEPIRFITFTDVHASVVNPASRLGSYEEDIFDKLNQIRKVGEKSKVDFFLFGGDLFNLKYPMRNPHELNSKLIKLFKSFPAPIYATEGNHDLRNDSYETFQEQPLCVIYSSGALIQTRDERFEVKGLKVRIRSFPFKEEPNLLEIPKAKDGTADLNICLLHLYSSLEGGALFKQKIYSYKEIAELGDDVFLLGHYHLDQGIETLEHDGVNQTFVNVGAISRGSLADDKLERIPQIGFVEVSKPGETLVFKCQSGKLRVKPFEQAFDVVKKAEEKKQLEDAEIFVSKLQSDLTVADDDEDRVKKEVMALDVDKEVLDKVVYFLEEAELTKKGLEV